MIDRVIDLVDDERECRAAARTRRARGWRPRRISAPLGLCGVLTQDQLRARVGEPHDLVDVERETVLHAAARSAASRGRARFRQLARTARTTASARRRWRPARSATKNSASNASAPPLKTRISSACAPYIDASAARSGSRPVRRAIRQCGAVERVALGVGHQRAQLGQRPLRPRAHPEMVLDRISIFRKPLFEYKWHQFHACSLQGPMLRRRWRRSARRAAADSGIIWPSRSRRIEGERPCDF